MLTVVTALSVPVAETVAFMSPRVTVAKRYAGTSLANATWRTSIATSPSTPMMTMARSDFLFMPSETRIAGGEFRDFSELHAGVMNGTGASRMTAPHPALRATLSPLTRGEGHSTVGGLRGVHSVIPSRGDGEGSPSDLRDSRKVQGIPRRLRGSE